MKPLEFDRRIVLHVELLQALRTARVGVTLKLAVRMQRGYAAAISLLERLQVAVRAYPQLPVQLEKIDLVSHALSPVHGGVPAYAWPFGRPGWDSASLAQERPLRKHILRLT